jgi:hypothetical protein
VVGGRINVREKPIHYYVDHAALARGEYADEYGEEAASYSGGVITRNFLCFHGRHMDEQGWSLQASETTTIGAMTGTNGISFFTTDPVVLTLRHGGHATIQTTTPYRLFSRSAKKEGTP